MSTTTFDAPLPTVAFDDTHMDDEEVGDQQFVVVPTPDLDSPMMSPLTPTTNTPPPPSTPQPANKHHHYPGLATRRPTTTTPLQLQLQINPHRRTSPLKSVDHHHRRARIYYRHPSSPSSSRSVSDGSFVRLGAAAGGLLVGSGAGGFVAGSPERVRLLGSTTTTSTPPSLPPLSPSQRKKVRTKASLGILGTVVGSLKRFKEGTLKKKKRAVMVVASSQEEMEFNNNDEGEADDDDEMMIMPTSPTVFSDGQVLYRSRSLDALDYEMTPPLSPITNYSPVSISSSTRRARNRGKAMRVLGYEAYKGFM